MRKLDDCYFANLPDLPRLDNIMISVYLLSFIIMKDIFNKATTSTRGKTDGQAGLWAATCSETNTRLMTMNNVRSLDDNNLPISFHGIRIARLLTPE